MQVQLLVTVISDSLRSHGSQDPVSTGFLRKEYWSGLPFPSPGNISNGICQLYLN